MKNKILLCTLAAALAACGFATTKTSAAEKSGGMPMRGKILQRIAERLELTADQKSKIEPIFSGEKERLQPLLAALHHARKNLRAAIHASAANETAVRAASAKAASAEADLAVERMKLYAKLAPVLNDEQRAKLAELEARVDDFASHAIAQISSELDN